MSYFFKIAQKGMSKNIEVFILFRFTEFEKILPFYKNISVFVYRSLQSDESIEMWVQYVAQYPDTSV